MSTQCGMRRPGWETPGPGRHRLPCVLDSGHDGRHRDAFGEEWAEPLTPARLLPWNSADGKAAYLVTDPSGESPLSLLADRAEQEQMANAREVLRLATESAEIATASADELRWVVKRVCECLADLLRVAESRGSRL